VRSGLLVPSEGEVGWYSGPGGTWQAVWRGGVKEVSYEMEE
jgi:hypothetical protein